MWVRAMRVFDSIEIKEYCAGNAGLLEDGEAGVWEVGKKPGCTERDDAWSGGGWGLGREGVGEGRRRNQVCVEIRHEGARGSEGPEDALSGAEGMAGKYSR